MRKSHKGIRAACKPQGRDKPPRKKLAQRSTYRIGYATELLTRTLTGEEMDRTRNGLPTFF